MLFYLLLYLKEAIKKRGARITHKKPSLLTAIRYLIRITSTYKYKVIGGGYMFFVLKNESEMICRYEKTEGMSHTDF